MFYIQIGHKVKEWTSHLGQDEHINPGCLEKRNK